MSELAQIAQAAIETARSFVSGGRELVEATGQSPEKAMNALLDKLQAELDTAVEELTKTVSGRTHDRGDFLVAGNADEPSTWSLPVKVRGKPDHRLMGGAWAALHQGYRGNKYEGPGKQAALSKLKALYKAEDMPIPGEQSEADAPATVIAVTPEQVKAVLKFLWTRFGGEGDEEEEAPARPAPPERGAEEAEAEDGDVAEVDLAESSSGQIIGLAEDTLSVVRESIVPLKLRVAIIQPGWGNAKDGHFYPPETLRRDSAAVFPGIKMYESDHRDEEKSTRTWVSTVDEVVGFTEDGAPIGKVIVHDEGFAKRLLALNEAGMLNKMECSILGTGKVRKGEIDGRKGKVVEAITAARSVDWVTRGGAGGHALNLAESEDQSKSGGDDMTEEHKEQEQVEEAQIEEQVEVAMLSETAVAAILDEATLPDAAKAKLKAAEYKNEEAVKEALVAEVAYLKEVTGAGKPVMHGDRETVRDEPMSEAEDNAAWDKIRVDHGLAPLYGGTD